MYLYAFSGTSSPTDFPHRESAFNRPQSLGKRKPDNKDYINGDRPNKKYRESKQNYNSDFDDEDGVQGSTVAINFVNSYYRSLLVLTAFIYAIKNAT